MKEVIVRMTSDHIKVKGAEYVRDLVSAKPIKDYEGYYEVDQFGRVFSVDRTITVNDNGRVYEKPIKGKQISQALHSRGYKIVSLTKDGTSKTFYVHRLVAEAFIDNPLGLPFINHKDEDRTNNFVENLEWCDAQYNSNYGTARERQANALKGRPLSEEHREKIKQSNIGKHNKIDSDYRKKRRNWEEAFQRWSNKWLKDGTESYGACGYGSMCDWCKDNSYGKPCVRALNDMCREKNINIDYSIRDFERVWNDDFCSYGEVRDGKNI